MNGMSIKEQATFWLLKLQAEDTTCAERTAFADWLTADPDHSAAYFELESLWGRMEPLAETVEVEQGFAHADSLAREAKRRRIRWTAGGAAVAAAIAMAVALTFFFEGRSLYRTEVGELRVVTLKDGSTVMLNTDTSLEVRYKRDARYLHLEYGQANFQVEQDPDRPFVVVAGKGAVYVLGTRFDVYKAGDKITVTLMEGRVKVAPLEQRDSRPEPRLTEPFRETLLQPGEQLSYNQLATMALPVAKVDLERVAAWQQRRLDFYNTPLKDVVREANRYSPLKIELMTDRLRERRMTGVFEAGKSSDVIAAIQAYFNIDITRTLDNRVLIDEKEGCKPQTKSCK